MSDDNNSGGIIGTIISILILAAIWPYLLAILALYIAYQAALAILAWMAQNPITVVLIIIALISIYAIYHYRLIPKAWKWLINEIQRAFRLKTVKGIEDIGAIVDDVPDLNKRTFIPSTNLYCYWCTKKLGLNAWERGGKYYCDECKSKQLINL